MAQTLELEDPSRYPEIRRTILTKPFLRAFYLDVYERYRDALLRSPREGKAIELGSGAGFVKQELPEILTTDIIHYPGLDQVVDGTKMPYAETSIRFIGMLNVLHHIPDAARFFEEVDRVLVHGGRLFLRDQNRGWISRWLLKYLHHEGWDDRTREWRFTSEGPLSSANGALAWIIFVRDRTRFEELYPRLKIEWIRPVSPLLYWVSGGLERPAFVPGWALTSVRWLDRLLLRIHPAFGSFLDIEILKR